ncbi:MAG: GMC family oxidoreductase [Myxococcales bacterium]|nr:GMC family oxidoreductase [Myxococcales bacterium]
MATQANPGNTDAETFDYIVVGGGSAGCIVAEALSRDPNQRVLLLEAGLHANQSPETLAADQYKYAFINPELLWERFSIPQTRCRNARLFQGSGRGLGGSGAVNAMVYTRGSAYDYDSWGLPGWKYADVEPDFDAIEQVLGVNRLPPTRFTEACIAAAEESGFRRKENLNDGALCGFLGYEWMNLNPERNERRSSYVSFLRPQEGRKNLSIRTGAAVTKLILRKTDGQHAVAHADGVAYLQDGTLRRALARKEVILSAGALESPRILQLSGIGDGAALQRVGIEPMVELPSVGRNLMDHPNVSVFFLGKQESDCSWAQLYGFHRVGQHVPQGEADSCFVFYSARSSFREGMLRMLPTMALPPSLYRMGWPKRALQALIRGAFRLGPVQKLVHRMYGVVVILGKPQSRGTVQVGSPDPAQPALIDPAYFAIDSDLETMINGVELARNMASSSSLTTYGNRELIPGVRSKSRDRIARFLKQNVMTTYHYAGTCKMGIDPESVVDLNMRVRNVSGLRVADASVIPSVPVSAMNAPSMLIGHRAARYLTESGR